MPKVGILNFSISNLASVQHAFHYMNIKADIVSDSNEFENYTHLVLPGVGSFARGMENLARVGFTDPLLQWAQTGKPILGLCLGMQLLAEEGDEFGPTEGLGLIPGRITKMKLGEPDLRLPHIGWNKVIETNKSLLLENLKHDPTFYFVHSYCYENSENDYVTGICEYGGHQVAIVEKGNVFGVQFHPEKSQKAGLALLKNFVSIGCHDA